MFASNPVGACGPLYFSTRKLTNNKVEAFGMKWYMKKRASWIIRRLISIGYGRALLIHIELQNKMHNNI